MDDPHSLLERQLRKSSCCEIDDMSDELEDFVERVNQSYHNFDHDHQLLERSLELSSDELVETNKELREALDDAEREAYYDSVTGLPNRKFFNERLDEVIKSQEDDRQSAIIFIDFDGFKELNDAYGHPFGDKILEKVSRKLSNVTRDNDLLARWGGDQFVVIIEGISREHDVIRRLVGFSDLFESPFEIENKICHIKISMGITIHPSDGDNPGDLLGKADMAMYTAKEESGNSYRFYEPGGVDELKEEISIKNDLRRALKADEIEVHYQPRVGTMKQNVLGYEALARWKHPAEGNIEPATFIPVAESSGLIVELEKVIFDQACSQLNQWGDRYDQNRELSINLSSQHLQTSGFISRIMGLLDEYDLNPELLELEITETELMRNIEATVDILDHLKDLGVRIAMDDFGTGYSSLEYLMSLPIDTLKIDHSFVNKVTDDEFSLELVKMIHTVASELDLNVVAEGVETEEQFETMKNFSDEIQGFLFARPKPPAEINASPNLSRSKTLKI